MWPVATRDELLAGFPWAAWEDLQNKAQDLRRRGASELFRPKRKFLPTGHAPTDAVLEEAYRSRLTLTDVDAIADTRGYFGSGRHRLKVQWRYVGRAIEALGGEIDVGWPE